MNAMIEIIDLNKRFGKLQVLRDLNVSIKRGKISAVLGPNGSGKTTLIKCILGLVIPDSGDIYIHGERINGEWQYRNKIGYMPQIANFPDNLTARELIRMIRDLRKEKASEIQLATEFGILEHLDKSLKDLSGGTKQKVNAILAMLFAPDILIFDEPTAGLDPVARLHLKDCILDQRNAGKTILLTTHIMSEVEELADEIVFLLEGKIYFQGSVEELKSRQGEENLERAIAGILRGTGLQNGKANHHELKSLTYA